MFGMTSDQARAIDALDAWQAGASSDESSFFCLQGYAGVGKTWLTVEWLARVLKARPSIRIVVTAPTNKAVDVLRQKAVAQAPQLLSAVEFRTLDSFLGFRVKRNDDWEMERSRSDRKGGDAPDLVLVDEASMVKQEYHAELRARRVPVLYVGDPAQLQPVGEDTSPAFNVPDKVLMTEVVRQGKGNPIIELATWLRGKIDSDSNNWILQDVRGFSHEGDRRIAFTSRAQVHGWAEQAIAKGLDCRILAFTNAAVNEHNATMHARRYPDAPLFGEGELVLVNEAFDYDDDTLLTNGELLRVVSCTRTEDTAGVETYEVRAVRLANSLEVDGDAQGRELTMLVARKPDEAVAVHRQLTNEIYDVLSQVRDLERKGHNASKLRAKLNELYATRRPLNKLAPLRHAYACTVHKSQGSTYDVAMVDFNDVYRSREMRSRLMYVAATRPSQFLVMVHNGG